MQVGKYLFYFFLFGLYCKTETLGGNRDLASILICLTQLSMIYAEKVITYMIEKWADVK